MFWKEFDSRCFKKIYQSHHHGEKKQTFAGLLYSYFLVCYFNWISIWRNTIIFSVLRLNLLPLNFLNSAFSLKPQRGRGKHAPLLCALFSVPAPCGIILVQWHVSLSTSSLRAFYFIVYFPGGHFRGGGRPSGRGRSGRETQVSKTHLPPPPEFSRMET